MVRRLAAIAATVTVVCAARLPSAYAQERTGARSAAAPRHAVLTIIRAYDAGSAPVAVAPAPNRLRLITDYDAGAPEYDEVTMLPVVVISGLRSGVARLGLYTAYDGSRTAPLEALAAAARGLPIAHEYDASVDPSVELPAEPLALPEMAIAGDAPPATVLGAIRVMP